MLPCLMINVVMCGGLVIVAVPINNKVRQSEYEGRDVETGEAQLRDTP